MLHRDQIHPIGGRILLEAIFEETTFGPEGDVEFAVPPDYQNRYPNAGWYIRGGPSDFEVEPDNIVILKDEGEKVNRSYYDVFRLILEDDNSGERFNLVIDIEALVPFEEAMNAFYANPSEEKDIRVCVRDVEGTPWTFEKRDVLDFGVDHLAHPTYTLEYVPTKMLELAVSETQIRLHYLVDPRRAILILKDW